MTKYQKLILQRHLRSAVAFYRSMQLSYSYDNETIGYKAWTKALLEVQETLRMLQDMPTVD